LPGRRSIGRRSSSFLLVEGNRAAAHNGNAKDIINLSYIRVTQFGDIGSAQRYGYKAHLADF
jgi:hypothetical protein